MPTVPANTNARVLVTGANGYVALWVVRSLLDQGYCVRGTVRSEDKGKQLQELFSSYGNKFEWVVVRDITKEDAFDEFVKDVDAIEHTASPVSPDSTEDPQTYIRPAVDGTLSVLASALKFGKNVKRIVVTSSAAAMIRPFTGATSLTESDWGDEYVKLVEEQGKDASSTAKYIASKTLSEKAAWSFYEKHKAEIGWDLVVLNPTHIIGPPIQDFKVPEDLNLSLKIWYDNIFKKQSDDILKSTLTYVDIHDVADAHIEALKKKDAGGERIIVHAGSSTWQDSRNIIAARKPEYYNAGILPRGNPDLKTEILLTLNSQKTQKILGIEYRSLEESTFSTLAEFEKRGLVA